VLSFLVLFGFENEVWHAVLSGTELKMCMQKYYNYV
jgi:hypothetical protein